MAAPTPRGPNPGPDANSAALATFVAGIAHEINNPITYVLTNLGELAGICGSLHESLLAYRSAVERSLGSEAADLIARAEASIEKSGGLDVLDELVDDAMEGAERIRDVVQDLLSLSQPSASAKATIDVHDSLDATLRLVQRQLAQRAELVRDYASSGHVRADSAKLGQVFLNLITNAIHACEPSESASHTITVRTRDVENRLEIEVEDSGDGIPEQARANVFKPFFTTKKSRGGTGLGLFISREIIDQHGGGLDFRARPGGGTIFRIILPAS